jgi:hypothetical protein
MGGGPFPRIPYHETQNILRGNSKQILYLHPTPLHILFRGISTVTGYKTMRTTYKTSSKFNFVKHNPRLLAKYLSELKKKFHAAEDVNAIAYLKFPV